MNCKYSYNKEDSQYLHCSISKDICPLMKYCYKVGKFVSSDNYITNCKYYQGKEDNDMNKKQGSLRVRLVNKNMLFVELGDKYNQVVKVNNPYQYEPTYVDLIELDGNYHVKGFEPKPIKKVKKEMDLEVNIEEKKEDD